MRIVAYIDEIYNKRCLKYKGNKNIIDLFGRMIYNV